MNRRFFVTVIAPSRLALLNLREYDLDLFGASAARKEQKELTIDGLLTLEQVGHLVENGYSVLVKEESSKRARAQHEVIEFENWLKGMKGE